MRLNQYKSVLPHLPVYPPPSGASEPYDFSGIDFNDEGVCKALMAHIRPYWLLQDSRIRFLINDRIKVNERKRSKKQLKAELMQHAVSGGILFSAVVASVASLPSSPIKKFSELKLHCLLCAWVMTKGHDKVFSSDNIAAFKTYDHGMINKEILQLMDMDIITRLTDVEVHKYSKKFVKQGGKAGRTRIFYRLSRRGDAILKDFFELYEKMYFKLLKEQFAADLPASLDSEFDELEAKEKEQP